MKGTDNYFEFFCKHDVILEAVRPKWAISLGVRNGCQLNVLQPYEYNVYFVLSNTPWNISMLVFKLMVVDK